MSGTKGPRMKKVVPASAEIRADHGMICMSRCYLKKAAIRTAGDMSLECPGTSTQLEENSERFFMGNDV